MVSSSEKKWDYLCDIRVLSPQFCQLGRLCLSKCWVYCRSSGWCSFQLPLPPSQSSKLSVRNNCCSAKSSFFPLLPVCPSLSFQFNHYPACRPSPSLSSCPLLFAPVFESDCGLPVLWSLILQGEDAESLSPCLEDPYLSLPNPGAFPQCLLPVTLALISVKQ